jgi:hypothetical protein
MRKFVHYKEPRDDHGPTFHFLTCFDPGGLAALLVIFHFNPHGSVALHVGNYAAPLTWSPRPNHRRNPMKHNMSLREVSDLLNVRMHRIEYCLSNQIVPEPKLRIAGKRLFTPADLRRLATHFNVTLPAAETAAEPTAVVGV